MGCVAPGEKLLLLLLLLLYFETQRDVLYQKKKDWRSYLKILGTGMET